MTVSKEKLLEKIKPRDYHIYGIFDFKKKRLVYIHLDREQVDLEFELSGYNPSQFDVVEFTVRLI